jgi:hypothetical protein
MDMSIELIHRNRPKRGVEEARKSVPYIGSDGLVAGARCRIEATACAPAIM